MPFDPAAYLAKLDASDDSSVSNDEAKPKFDPAAYLAKMDAVKESDNEFTSDEYAAPQNKSGSVPTTTETKDRAVRKAATEKAQKAKEDKRGFFEKAGGGIEAGISTLSGAASGFVAPIAGVMTAAAGRPEKLKEYRKKAAALGISVPEVIAREFQEENTYQPRGEAGKEYAQEVGEAIEPVMQEVGKLPLGDVLHTSPGAITAGLAGPAVKRAAGMAAPVTGPAIAGLEAAGSAVGSQLAKVPTPHWPKISAATAKLAQQAENLGIEIPVHMLYDNKQLKQAGELIHSLPAVGSKRIVNKAKFNDLLGDILGSDKPIEALTPDIYNELMVKQGERISEPWKNVMVTADDPYLAKGMEKYQQGLEKLTPEIRSAMEGYTNELGRAFEQHEGVVSGTLLKQMHSNALRDGRRTTNPEMKRGIDLYKDALEDAAVPQMTKEEYAIYKDASSRYAQGMVLEPLMAKASTFGIEPHELIGRQNASPLGRHAMARGKQGDIGTLAAIAGNFMKPEQARRVLSGMLGSEGLLTAGGGLVGGVGGAAVGAAGGVATLGVGMLIGQLYNRLGPRIARRVIKTALNDDKLAQQLTRPVEPEPMALADENTGSPFAPKPTPEYPVNPLLSADQSPNQPGGTLPKGASAVRKTGEPYSGNAPPTAGNEMNFTLRQEVLQQPVIKAATDAFREEQANLEKIVKNAINPAHRQKAMADLRELKTQFAAGMRELGIDTPQEAHGMTRPLYESGVETKLPIKKTYSMGEGDIPHIETAGVGGTP